jgi:excisionase family DNA binding protein
MRDFVMSPQDLAREMHRHNRTVLRLIKNGEIDARRLGGRYYISADEAARILGYWPKDPTERAVSA